MCSEEAEALAKKLKLRFYRTSVKEDLNVSEGKVPLNTNGRTFVFSSYAFSLCGLEIMFLLWGGGGIV